MADVIFRGVKIPENCAECFFWSICPCLADFDDYSSILDAVSDGDLVRHEECPVSPIPEGHGRIVDAAEILEKANNSPWFDGDVAELGLLLGSEVTTIVPSEGGTDNGT